MCSKINSIEHVRARLLTIQSDEKAYFHEDSFDGILKLERRIFNSLIGMLISSLDLYISAQIEYILRKAKHKKFSKVKIFTELSVLYTYIMEQLNTLPPYFSPVHFQRFAAELWAAILRAILASLRDKDGSHSSRHEEHPTTPGTPSSSSSPLVQLLPYQICLLDDLLEYLTSFLSKLDLTEKILDQRVEIMIKIRREYSEEEFQKFKQEVFRPDRERYFRSDLAHVAKFDISIGNGESEPKSYTTTGSTVSSDRLANEEPSDGGSSEYQAEEGEDSSSIPTEPDESSEDKNDIDELSNGNSSEEHSVVLSMSPPFATENGKLTSSSNPGEKKKDTDKKKGSPKKPKVISASDKPRRTQLSNSTSSVDTKQDKATTTRPKSGLSERSRSANRTNSTGSAAALKAAKTSQSNTESEPKATSMGLGRSASVEELPVSPRTQAKEEALQSGKSHQRRTTNEDDSQESNRAAFGSSPPRSFGIIYVPRQKGYKNKQDT